MAAQHPNAGHPGPSMVQQMHPGVSAPGGPQVSQAGSMMGGMPQGNGTSGPAGPMPNAHALSHLNPAQAQHMFQQQGFPPNCEFTPYVVSPTLGTDALREPSDMKTDSRAFPTTFRHKYILTILLVSCK